MVQLELRLAPISLQPRAIVCPSDKREQLAADNVYPSCTTLSANLIFPEFRPDSKARLDYQLRG